MPSSNVLLVDDDPNLLRGLTRALRGQPFQVLTARSAEEALATVKAHPIGVIVSDERMPGQSGTELLAWIAQNCPEIVRIVLTGHTTPETTMRAVNEGRVFRFFSKPADSVELAMSIRDGLELHAAGLVPTARAGRSLTTRAARDASARVTGKLGERTCSPSVVVTCATPYRWR